VNGVTVIGATNLPGRVPQHASQVYAMNLFSFLEEFWDKNEKKLTLDAADEIVAAAMLTRDGQILDERFRA
jgi:NAD(P) transhydrogenase subunit alpha